MAWPKDVQEKRERTAIAVKLDRQEFWKAAYLISLGQEGSNHVAEGVANRALLDFDVKFKDAS